MAIEYLFGADVKFARLCMVRGARVVDYLNQIGSVNAVSLHSYVPCFGAFVAINVYGVELSVF